VDSLDRVMRICRDLPECLVEGDQHHTVRVRGKTMAWHTVNEHGDGRTALTVRAQAGENELLATSEPERYFLPRYVARYGYVGIYLDVADIDWDEIADFLFDAYRLVAPKSLARTID